ncbi:conserved hypothetical protein [Xenorhabdus bovienii str. puntauvense]|uniref:Ync n=1 Tax=Xenorhabdus bovienii str. puntauvense TaxID=1398201 RepID=A0A077NCX7_XENBV|nr:conserved hypothetical protein [Xenorhabdus bovienii str. puntauvense]
MDKYSPYYRQVALLISALLVVASERCFALKGGTAINLFVRDFPRLSVDIDLVYVPLESRDVALANVRATLTRITGLLQQQVGVSAILQTNNHDEMRIIVSSQEAQIKIEVSPVARGTLYPSQDLDVAEAVEDEFGFATIQVVSMADLYGGKLCAALDRQHPRDLYAHEFSGMTFDNVSLEELNVVPELMISALKSQFTQQDFDFLMSFKSGEPDWQLVPENQIQHLPAVKMEVTQHWPYT